MESDVSGSEICLLWLVSSRLGWRRSDVACALLVPVCGLWLIQHSA